LLVSSSPLLLGRAVYSEVFRAAVGQSSPREGLEDFNDALPGGKRKETKIWGNFVTNVTQIRVVQSDFNTKFSVCGNTAISFDLISVLIRSHRN
jgi:hypothetical protein